MLRSEGERVAQAEAWNHRLYYAGPIQEGSASVFGLVLPLHPGRSFAALSRDQQRSVLPRILPSLWSALSATWHGDLHPGNLLVDEDASVTLIDPGILLVEKAEVDDGDPDDSMTITFTTNTRHYPWVPPYDPGRPRAGCTLRSHIERFVASLTPTRPLGAMKHSTVCLPQAPAPSNAPTVADTMALGLMYYEVLTREYPGPTQPVWLDGQVVDDTPQFPFFDDVLFTIPPPSTLASDVRPEEDELVMRLVHGDVSSLDLRPLCEAVRGAS
ncbi:MAG: hypothetical protein AAGE52_36630 [Myxococcota bacterium]